MARCRFYVNKASYDPLVKLLSATKSAEELENMLINSLEKGYSKKTILSSWNEHCDLLLKSAEQADLNFNKIIHNFINTHKVSPEITNTIYAFFAEAHNPYDDKHFLTLQASLENILPGKINPIRDAYISWKKSYAAYNSHVAKMQLATHIFDSLNQEGNKKNSLKSQP